MNIFVTNECPELSAQALDNKLTESIVKNGFGLRRLHVAQRFSRTDADASAARPFDF